MKLSNWLETGEWEISDLEASYIITNAYRVLTKPTNAKMVIAILWFFIVVCY